MATENEAWLVTSKGKLFHFSNGGEKTEEVKFESAVRQIFFLKANEGWLLDANGQVWATANGGSEWLKSGKFDGGATGYYFSQLVFINKQIGWLVGDMGTTWLTEDDGKTWSQIYPTNEFSYSTFPGQPFIYFPVEENVGWLGMSNGKLLKTTNRGKNWENVSLSSDGDIYALYAFSKGECFVSPFQRGGIYRTENGGKEWEPVTKLENLRGYGIYSINFPTRKIGWATGIKFVTDQSSTEKLKGITLKTTDGGKTWLWQTGEFYENPFKEIKFTDERNGWLRSETAVYYTLDGGESWSKIFEIERELKSQK